MELNLPKTLIEEIGENELKLYLAMMLYKERKLSMGQAAKLAGLALSDFIYELGKHKIGVTNITEEELVFSRLEWVEAKNVRDTEMAAFLRSLSTKEKLRQ